MKIESFLSNPVAEIAKLNNVNKQEAEAILEENIKRYSDFFEKTKKFKQEEGDEKGDTKK